MLIILQDKAAGSGASIFDIINTINADGNRYGGRWSSSNPDYVEVYSNNIQGFAAVTDRLDKFGGWDTTFLILLGVI